MTLHLGGSLALQKVLIENGLIPDFCTELIIKLGVCDVVELTYTVLADEDKVARLCESFGQYQPKRDEVAA